MILELRPEPDMLAVPDLPSLRAERAARSRMEVTLVRLQAYQLHIHD